MGHFIAKHPKSLIGAVFAAMLAVILSLYAYYGWKSRRPGYDFYSSRIAVAEMAMGKNHRTNPLPKCPSAESIAAAPDVLDFPVFLSNCMTEVGVGKASRGTNLSALYGLGVSAYVSLWIERGSDRRVAQPRIGFDLSMPTAFYANPEMRRLFCDYIKHVSAAVGVRLDSAEISRIVAEETDLASLLPAGLSSRNASQLTEMTVAAFASRTSAFWRDFFDGLNVGPQVSLLINDLEAVDAVATHLTKVEAPTFESYIKWRVIAAYSDFADAEALAVRTKFQKSLGDVERKNIQDILNQLILNVYPGEAKFSPFTTTEQSAFFELNEDVLAVARDRAGNLPSPLRHRVAAKLKELRVFYPWQLAPKSSERQDQLTGDRVHRVLALARVQSASRLKLCGSTSKSPGELENVSAYNAWYNPLVNDIVVGAGLLRGRYIRDQESVGSLYGRIATVVGHGITHSIDGCGIYFDETGHLASLSDESRRCIDRRTATVLTELASYRHRVHRSFELLDGEMLADLGGMELAYAALNRALARKFPGDKQRAKQERVKFFEAYGDGQIAIGFTCDTESQRDFAEATDPHPSAEVRINVTLMHFKPFADVFPVAPDSLMDARGCPQFEVWPSQQTASRP